MKVAPDNGALARASDDIPSKAVVTNSVPSSARSQLVTFGTEFDVTQMLGAVRIGLDTGAAEDCDQEISLWINAQAVRVPVFMPDEDPLVRRRSGFDSVGRMLHLLWVVQST